MKLGKIDFRDTHSFSSFFLDYIEQKDSLKPFYNRFPSKGNFKKQIEEKSAFPQQHRDVLVDSLTAQYKTFEITEPVKQNIQLLKNSKTFTVTTGHQLNIFTGPLYFIFKIVTVINACKQLKELHPDCNFVPVYWMASEDHDYAEIKSFRLYGNSYQWKTEQGGAVGRFHTKDFKSLLEEVPGEISIFRDAYLKHKTLSEAVRYYVNQLFGSEGLIILDADDRSLKNILKPVIQSDLFDHTPNTEVEKTNQQLEKLGYHPQVNPREINFFYLENGLRARLESVNGEFHVVDSNLKFSKTEIETLIANEPEKFSPNVILRPLYQEMILPNLAYVGGPAELVYWLELKGVFDHFKVPFPMLMPRNFGMVVEQQVQRKIEKTGLELKDFFEEKNYLFNHWVVKNSQHELSLGKEMEKVMEILSSIKDRATKIDSTLTAFVGAEAQRTNQSLERIENKLVRAEKRLHQDKLRQIEAIKDALFPKGSLQERVDNFLNFYQQDPTFVQKLIQHFDPFDFRFNILHQP
jgi:bacillithiol biosynthesis cysteine-adding enzyme BshC